MLALGLGLGLQLLSSAPAQATEFGEFGQDLRRDDDTVVEVDGALRLRGSTLYNLDLDHGLTPSGKPLYPVPLSGGQSLRHADMRLRSDLAMHAPFAAMAVKLRVDVLDNLPLGSTPEADPLSSTTQVPPGERVLRIKRAWGEALTPFGVLAAGRMGAHWGLGMVVNNGDCRRCDTADASDRLAFVLPLFQHYWAFAYDLAYVGPQVQRKAPNRVVDLEPSDDVRGLSFAFLRWRDDVALQRRMKAGKYTFDYGALVGLRWQRNDVPAHYLPSSSPQPIGPDQLLRRNFSAQAYDVWLKLIGPALRLELEGAILAAQIEQASLVPGAFYEQALTSMQWGLALESDFGPSDGRISAGLDVGAASGDPAYGFGAARANSAQAPQPGDLDGPQASVPTDWSVNNFQFHPDYQVDRILFREIIGQVTDSFYIRPHTRWDIWRAEPGKLRLDLSATASWALFASSTPGSQTPLGVEIDPSLSYLSSDGFEIVFDYALLLPLSGFDNLRTGASARPAQLARLQLQFGF